MALTAATGWGGAASSASAAGSRSKLPPNHDPGAVILTVNATGQSIAVPRSFLGLSFETWDLYRMAGSTVGNPNPAFNNLVRGLDPGGTSPISYRVGGMSADASYYPYSLNAPAGTTYGITDNWFAVLGRMLHQSSSRAVLTLNMAQGDTGIATSYARAAVGALGARSIEAFEIGNEPDNYSTETFDAESARAGQPLRPANWGFADYLKDLARYSAALRATDLKGVPLAATAFASFKWFDPNSFASIDAAAGPTATETTWHRYPMVACGVSRGDAGYPTVDGLLDPAKQSYLINNFSAIVNHARQVGKPVRLTEFNTVGCGGTPGVSDTLAASLWSLRTLFDLASIGVSGVDAFNSAGLDYSAIVAPRVAGAFPIHAGALYYGMKLFAQATQNGARIVSTTQSTGSPLAAYTTRDQLGTTRVVIVNTSSRDVPVTVDLGTRRAATSDLLTAPTLNATSGINISGMTYDGSSDGLPHGRANRLTVASQRGTYSAVAPAHSALLLTVTG